MTGGAAIMMIIVAAVVGILTYVAGYTEGYQVGAREIEAQYMAKDRKSKVAKKKPAGSDQYTAHLPRRLS